MVWPESCFRRWFGRPRLEVVAQVPLPEPPPEAPVIAAAPDPVEAAATFVRDPYARREAPGAPAAGNRLPELLRRTGFSDVLLSRLSAAPAFSEPDDRPLHQAFVDVAEELRRHAASRPTRPLPARAAFLGPAGVGRTTALCKWLAIEVFRHGYSGRVVTVEFDRPNPTEQLAVFCEALGLPFEHQAVPAPAPAAGFVYLDLPAISLRQPSANVRLGRFLDQKRVEGRVLVLNAAYDTTTLRDAALGCLAGALLIRWFWQVLLRGFHDTFVARRCAAEDAAAAVPPTGPNGRASTPGTTTAPAPAARTPSLSHPKLAPVTP